MYKIHKPHLDYGYLAKISYEQTVDGAGKPDWMMLYQPGPRAIAEFQAFQKRTGAPPNIATVEEPAGNYSEVQITTMRDAGAPGSLEQELVRRGVSEDQARKLLSKTTPGQPVAEQISWGDQLVRENRGRIYNPPGFYIYLIRENVLPPSDFLATQTSHTTETTPAGNSSDPSLMHAYEEYRSEEIQHYIDVHYSPEAYEEAVAQIEKRVQKQYRSAALWRPENLREIAAGLLRQEVASRMSFVSFEEFTGKVSQ
jgi:hypothetical protein